ncbi:hypothetical protein OIU85_020611 [Salix viminalis]|uniref:Uncharacterized protein n=1 Tax=Salix viminalis TaxID=40686 RepID=A0A9Q0ZCR5_SALVM|nr:hypothetical protein OIU85_020611 [Salix viminalis]
MLSSRSFYLKRGGSMDGKGRILFWIKAVQQVFCHLHENVGNGQPSGSINRELDERNKVILASQGQVLESGEKRWLIRRQEETSRHLAAYNFVTINIIIGATSAIALGPCGVVDNLTLDSPWLIFSFSFVLTSTKALLPLISVCRKVVCRSKPDCVTMVTI